MYLTPWATHLQSYIPPVAHKVYILDCKACGAFLTNRGMKAVLLLRPTVALYSSDALPANCSVYTSSPQTRNPACSVAAPTSPRSCECLTQTLACHGCGSSVGYVIVLPCSRCTSSISSNRSTNGHRFVYHSGEVTGQERYYVQDEQGIVPQHPPPASALHNYYYRPPPFSLDHSQAMAAASRPGYLPTAPLDSEDVSTSTPDSPSPSAASVTSSVARESTRLLADYPSQLLSANRIVPSYVRAASPALSDSSTSSLPPLIQPSPPFGLPTERVEVPYVPPLTAGDVLYWHHLDRHGEIGAVVDDARARRRSWAIKSASGVRVPVFER
ncbi:hypothetical protein MKEN_00688400 [Mycena kentingensis (nom. inval.)]|nr:hypothetical protein MKEN_00688400 [Mycena kentingensis (nom. inval.)]